MLGSRGRSAAAEAARCEGDGGARAGTRLPVTCRGVVVACGVSVGRCAVCSCSTGELRGASRLLRVGVLDRPVRCLGRDGVRSSGRSAVGGGAPCAAMLPSARPPRDVERRGDAARVRDLERRVAPNGDRGRMPWGLTPPVVEVEVRVNVPEPGAVPPSAAVNTGLSGRPAAVVEEAACWPCSGRCGSGDGCAGVPRPAPWRAGEALRCAGVARSPCDVPAARPFEACTWE